jgi:diguanylate cyclase (GGDEF)-like protein/PAS domain S-box-containing protein
MHDFLTQFAPCGLVELTNEGVIVDANSTFLEWTGRSVTDLEGVPLRDLIDDGDRAEATAHAAGDQRTGPAGARSLTTKLQRADGSVVPVLISWRSEGSRVVAALFDATKREQFESLVSREQALAARQARRLDLLLRSAVRFADAMDQTTLAEELAAAAEEAYAATSAAVFLIDEDGTIVRVTGTSPFGEGVEGRVMGEQAMQLRSVVTIPDVTASSLISGTVATALGGAGVRGLLAAPVAHEGKQLGLLAVFFDHVRPFDGEARPLAEALTRQAGQVMARIELTNQLHRSAMLDEITGLPNRRLFEEQVRRSAQSDDLVGVAFIDLDGFKAVNDTLGHDAGDRILREAANRIQSVVRERDSVARFGGDEFVAVWTVPDIEAAQQVAERIRRAVAAPYDLPDGLAISASIGLAVSRVHPEPLVADRLVRFADQAMYRAKSAGGDRVVAEVV